MSTLTDEIVAVVMRARRRVLARRLLSSAVLASAWFFGALTVLLVLGTRVWDWWVPALLGLGSFGIGLARGYASAPDGAEVARSLDARWCLADAISTAFHFRNASSAVAEAQRRAAGRLLERLDLVRSFPFTFPRATLPAAGLAMAVCGLVFVRYGVLHRLDLRTPIADVRWDALGIASRPEQKAKSRESKPGIPDDLMTRLGTATTDDPANPHEHNALSGSAIDSGVQNGQTGSNATRPDEKSGEAEAASGSSEASAGAQKSGSESAPSSQEGAPQGAQQPGKSASASESAGLMSKLKEAMSSLLAQMKPSSGAQPPQKGQPSQQQVNGKQQSGQQSAQKTGQDTGGDASQEKSDESGASESEQMASGKGAGKSSDQNASAKPGSGMGHQDGSKELKNAEQLAAMGKLSEIIGKRSANVTGEMTIEPQNGPQQLKTGYTHSSARHGASGGDVNRDEVPVALQGYVQDYFDQVRKQAATKAAKPVTE